MKTVNAAVIGAGWFGDVHAECLLRAQSMLYSAGVKVTLHTVIDINEAAAVKCREKYGFLHHGTDWRAVIDDPEIDLVNICTDNKFHKEMSIAALEHGKHVFCEKPLADTSADAELMEAAAKRAGLNNMVDFHYRKVPALAELHNLIQAGRLGRIYHIKGMFLQDFGFTSPMTWRFKKELSGGGSIVTMGSHVIDAVRYLVGEIDEVAATGQTFIGERAYADTGVTDTCDVDDAMTVLLKFKNGAIGMLMTSWLCHGCRHHHELEIYGEKGSAKFNSERLNELELWLDDPADPLNGKKTVYIGRDNIYGELFNLKTGMGVGIKESIAIQMRDMIEGIVNGAETAPTFYDGMRSVQIMSSILEAAGTHVWVKVPDPGPWAR